MTNKTILIAEDDSALSQSLAIRLRRLGVSVMRTPDALHALVGVKRTQPDLIILDVNMPSGNGLAVCEMLAGDEQCRNIPVIIHTGLSDAMTIARCSQLGANYVRKAPGSPEQITEIARGVLGIDIDTAAEAVCGDEEPPAIEEKPCSHASNDGDELAAADTPPTAAIVTTAGASKQVGDPDPLTGNSNAVRRPTVLSIDDDPDISKALEMKLEPYGVKVLCAFNGEQGYTMAVEQRPDVIIADLVLPEAEGAYIVRRIRSNPAVSDTPIIVLTGQSYPMIKHQILSLGVDAFLTKPVSINHLLRELRDHVELRESGLQPRTTTADRAVGMVESPA